MTSQWVKSQILLILSHLQCRISLVKFQMNVYVKLYTNPLKYEVLMIFPRDKGSRRPLVYKSLNLNNFDLLFIVECKLLGVHLNSFLTWNTHIDYIVSKVNRCIFISYRARQFNFSQETMFTLYI